MNQIQGIGEVDVDPFAGSITDEELAIHLQNCLRPSGPDLLEGALGHIARYKDLTQLTRASGNRRTSLLRMLSIHADTSFSDVFTVTCALGFRMHFEAISMLRDRASDHR
ncbi:addiction module antidote protein [Pseudomonas sp. NPDC086251]|uniref:addiction module antidote protein n=1 Tax=Pseudomonas sp. NPDC086251 TaxID=3364431 RepID=UPI003837B6F0